MNRAQLKKLRWNWARKKEIKYLLKSENIDYTIAIDVCGTAIHALGQFLHSHPNALTEDLINAIPQTVDSMVEILSSTK